MAKTESCNSIREDISDVNITKCNAFEHCSDGSVFFERVFIVSLRLPLLQLNLDFVLSLVKTSATDIDGKPSAHGTSRQGLLIISRLAQECRLEYEAQ